MVSWSALSGWKVESMTFLTKVVLSSPKRILGLERAIDSALAEGAFYDSSFFALWAT